MTQAPQWNVSGDYYETCSCDYVCPCLPGNLTAKQPNGDCVFAMIFHVNQGRYGNVSLDGLNWAAIGRAPGPTMADGNIEVGIIVDQRATQEQRDALAGIGSGQAGGPMAMLGPFVGKMLGIEAAPFDVQRSGMKWSAKVGSFIDEGAEGVPGANATEPLYMDNTIHPANSRISLAHATHSSLHALGLSWDDRSGNNNGQYAPFNWRSA